jgi:carbon-monoxide dehydrogenase medium subunit
VYDGAVEVTGPDGERMIPLEEWFVGPRSTRLGTGEMVTAVTLELPATDHAGIFLKLSRYSGEDLAQANLAVLTTASLDYRLAFGAVAPTPVRARRIESKLAGREVDDELLDLASQLVADEIAPITDIRATAAYRTHMCHVMLRRGLRAAAQRLTGDGPPYGSHLI